MTPRRGLKMPCNVYKAAIVLPVAVLLFLFTLYYRRVTHSSRVFEPPPSTHHYIVRPEEGSNPNYLLDLDSIPWPNVKRPNISHNLMVANLAPFDMKMSPGQYATLERLISQFEQVMISLKLQDQWFLGAGSLLGSLQHHDLIPWDDDADLCVHLRHRSRIQEALTNLQPEFGMFWHHNRDKLFFKPLEEGAKTDLNTIGSHAFFRRPWAWPFIDIFYYREIDATLRQTLVSGTKKTD
ncbi:lipopolysaccharide choline [Echinococcus multilocularis]|uniref:Lipopolysaccharide choline n=2 Tax=Echinococcus multilocularis TaxID=6211 RepID=A0A068Y3R3_ECHMU|nr:lipopolysaccharide choline [Echinococcus multilocularis]